MLQILPLCLTSLQLPTFSLNTIYKNMHLHYYIITQVTGYLRESALTRTETVPHAF